MTAIEWLGHQFVVIEVTFAKTNSLLVFKIQGKTHCLLNLLNWICKGSFQKVSAKNIWNFPYVGGEVWQGHFPYGKFHKPLEKEFSTALKRGKNKKNLKIA